ncbi:MAG: glycosyltransferase [Terriglobales bacterium]
MPELSAPGQIRVSVIIPTLNEESAIGGCLDALCALDFPPPSFEVIIVDNGSTDGTLQIAESYRDRLNLRLIQQKGVYVSALRNLGASQARGEFLFFLDADCLAPAGWLADGIRHLAEANHDLVGGRYEIPPDSTWIARIWHEDREASRMGEVTYLPGCNGIIRRDVFARLRGFDASLQTNEDCEFCRRARASGFKVWAFRELGVIHLGTPQTLADFFRMHRWHGKHVLRVFLRNLPKLHNLVPLAFAVYILGWLLAAAVGFFAAVRTGEMRWFAIALLAPLVPMLLISLRRCLQRGRIQETVPLTALYLLYGAARAAALLDLQNFGARPAATHSSLSPERRAKQRFALRLPIVVTAVGSEIHAVTHDVSSGGVFFYAEDWPIDDNVVEFNMLMPSELTLSENMGAVCRGRVVRVEDTNGGGRGIAARIESYQPT